MLFVRVVLNTLRLEVWQHRPLHEVSSRVFEQPEWKKRISIEKDCQTSLQQEHNESISRVKIQSCNEVRQIQRGNWLAKQKTIYKNGVKRFFLPKVHHPMSAHGPCYRFHSQSQSVNSQALVN
jgi:hypothetical protein